MPGEFDFPRRERLRNRNEFQAIYAEGRKWVAPAFICFVVQREGQGRKFGCAVSQKVGRAVVRNRVKRYLRECYRTQRPNLADDVHVVIVARPTAAQLDFAQTRAAIQRLFAQGGILSE